MASIAALGGARVAPRVGARSRGDAGPRGRTASARVSAEAGESGVTATVVPRASGADAALATRPSREACLPAASTEPSAAVAAFLEREGRHAMFQGSMQGAVRVSERADARRRDRGLRDYMALPASQYNTLDGETVTRKGDDVFVCELGALDFLGFEVRPVLTAKVDVQPNGRGTVIRVESAELRGSSLVERADDLFEIDSVNRVGWRYVRDDADSETDVVCDSDDDRLGSTSRALRTLRASCPASISSRMALMLSASGAAPGSSSSPLIASVSEGSSATSLVAARKLSRVVSEADESAISGLEACFDTHPVRVQDSAVITQRRRAGYWGEDMRCAPATSGSS